MVRQPFPFLSGTSPGRRSLLVALAALELSISASAGATVLADEAVDDDEAAVDDPPAAEDAPAAEVLETHPPDVQVPATPLPPSKPALAEGFLPGLQEGRSTVAFSAGFPWLAFRYQRGWVGGWSPVVEVESALLVRTTASLGLARLWLEKPHLRLGGQVTVGYLIQATLEEEAGPTFEASMTLATRFKRICPMLELSTRHTALLTALTHEALEQDTLVVNVKHQWAPRATLGLAAGLTPWLALDAGLDLTWFGPGTVSIPGLHVGLSLGWDRPMRAGGSSK